jgi:hypothetical protein
MDYFRKAKSLFSTTANTFSTGTGVTITPNSITGLPTDTEITLTFDRVDSGGTATPTKMERIIGTISGSNFVVRTDPSSGRGVDGTADQAHTSPVVEYIPNAEDMNDLVDGLLVAHDQDGAHKSSLTLTTPTISAPVFSGTATGTYTLAAPALSGSVTGTYTLAGTPTITSPALTLSNSVPVTSGRFGYDDTNQELVVGNGSAALTVRVGAWKAFTPTMTNVTKGAGTLTGRYCKVGKSVSFTIELTWAADTAFTGAPDFTLPVASTGPAQTLISALYYDATGGNAYNIGVVNLHLVNQKLYPYAIACSGTYAYYTAVSATVPMTWTTNDVMVINGTYEAA